MMQNLQIKTRLPFGRFLLCAATLGFSFISLAGLDPTKPPSGNFDLSRWKLTLPDAVASELLPAQLMAGATNESFFTAADGAMVFSCPVTGGTTTGSLYPRCELRELVDPLNENVNWTGYGTHVLNAQCRVTQIASSGKTIIGQIHSYSGKGFPLVKLQFNKNKVEALVKQSPNSSTDTNVSFGTAALGDLITYQIKVADGLLSMTVNDTNRSFNFFESDPAWTNQTFYFKAGNYCQDNSGPTNEAAVVWFYDLNVTHSAPAALPPVLSDHAMNANGQFMFTVLGESGGNYAIQASTDLENWSDLITTNAVDGGFEFADAASPAISLRFYRAIRIP